MMERRRDRVRMLGSLVLSMLMLTLSVAVPLLERADIVGRTAVESEHDPATCPTAHDHTICTQVGANLPHVAGRPGPSGSDTEVALVAAVFTWVAQAHGVDDGHRSRAPPLA